MNRTFLYREECKKRWQETAHHDCKIQRSIGFFFLSQFRQECVIISYIVSQSFSHCCLWIFHAPCKVYPFCMLMVTLISRHWYGAFRFGYAHHKYFTIIISYSKMRELFYEIQYKSAFVLRLVCECDLQVFVFFYTLFGFISSGEVYKLCSWHTGTISTCNNHFLPTDASEKFTFANKWGAFQKEHK